MRRSSPGGRDAHLLRRLRLGSIAALVAGLVVASVAGALVVRAVATAGPATGAGEAWTTVDARGAGSPGATSAPGPAVPPGPTAAPGERGHAGGPPEVASYAQQHGVTPGTAAAVLDQQGRLAQLADALRGEAWFAGFAVDHGSDPAHGRLATTDVAAAAGALREHGSLAGSVELVPARHPGGPDPEHDQAILDAIGPPLAEHVLASSYDPFDDLTTVWVGPDEHDDVVDELASALVAAPALRASSGSYAVARAVDGDLLDGGR